MPRVLSRFLLAFVAALVATSSISFRPGPAAAAGTGSVSLTTIGDAYSQNFNSLDNTALSITSTALPTGWYLAETGSTPPGTRFNDMYAVGTGSDNAGDTYSFGAAAGTDRAFGTLRSGSVISTIGASFTNNTGVSITGLDIGFIGEMWRAGVLNRNAADRLDFEISIDATSLATGSWSGHDALDYHSTSINTSLGAKNGNDPSFRAAVFSSITGLSIANGATFWIRWTDSDISSSDDGLAIDDLSLTPTTDETPAVNLSINDVTMNEGDAGTTSFVFTVGLSEPAGDGGVTFDIATSDDSAEEPGDYTANALTSQTISAGSDTYNFTVLVNGDTDMEPHEAFFVDVTNVAGASVVDGHGIGTIRTDDINPCDTSANNPFYRPTYAIQGSGAAAAITGDVITKGVVVGDFPGGTGAGMEGFYIQDPVGDGDAATADGIFVYTGAGDAGVTTGDLVAVEGFARERFNETAINGSNSNNAVVTKITNCGSGTVTATDVTLPWASATFPERYEGMLVRFPQALVIAEYFNYDQFGEIVLALPLAGETRPFSPTAVETPGVDAQARLLANQLSRITLDDNKAGSNPVDLRHPNGDLFALDNRFRGGDTVTNTIGVMGFAFSLYRILPVGAAEYTSLNPRPEAPEPVGGRVTVAAMNTLNFFLTPDYPLIQPGNIVDPRDNKCGPSKTLECRGHDFDQPAELQRQRDKLLLALAGLDADVIGLNELENTTDVDPVGDPENGIVKGLNDALGAGTYAAINSGVIGTDAIKVGMIYRPDVVTPVGPFAWLTSSVDPRFVDVRSRPALAQTFVENATGAKFTVVVNHLKSKGSACTQAGVDVPPDPDMGDGQGNCNKTREKAAQALVDWLAGDPTGSGDPDFLIMGDLNSYAMEDPITAIKIGPDDTAGTDDDYTNLINHFQGDFAYSYTFDGMAGYLDHALANEALFGQITGATEWHINSDEPDVVDYDTSFKPPSQEALWEATPNRSSDHDSVRVGLDLDYAPPTIVVVAGGTCGAGAGGTILTAVDSPAGGTAALTLSLTGNTNTALVANARVVVSGTGASRAISISATNGVSGTAILSFTLSDGITSVPFTVTVKIGTDDHDSLTGTAGPDLLVGLQGNDTLTGLGDGDLLCGGNGVDVLMGGDGDDTLDGDRANDVLSGGAGDDALRGGLGIDSLTGGTGADAFSGGAGADVNVDFTPADGDTSDGS